MTGWYILSVISSVKKGTINGTFDNGLARLHGPVRDGTDKIIFGFDPELTQSIAIYNRGNAPAIGIMSERDQ